jgi:glycosyltransferase involved in cell wall biosynthesis
MRIAIFDYKIITGNPAGNCHLTLLRSLAREHKFTVFSVQFENPNPEAITWIRVPSPTRPLALLFVVFHMLAPLVYLWHKIRTGERFDIVQSVESNLCFGGLVYSHFSHATYLRHHRTTRRGLRGVLRWIDNWLHACAERFRYPAAKLIVTPSNGLAEELKRDFRVAPERVSVIANPIPVKRMERPEDFGRDDFRRRLGLAVSDFVLVFSALGQFERKGLPLILESLATPSQLQTRLLVVGGEPDLIADYRRRADVLGLGNRVYFVGMQADVRPFLWCGDAFVLPSAYESFSLVTYEAAAAGLPILAPPLNGIRDLLRDGENGFLVTRSKPSITSALERITTLSEKQRQEMGENARRSAASFSEERFVDAWRSLYGNLKGPFAQQQQVEPGLIMPRRLARISPFRFLSHF